MLILALYIFEIQILQQELTLKVSYYNSTLWKGDSVKYARYIHIYSSYVVNKPGQQVLLHNASRWSFPIQGNPPQAVGGSVQVLFCSLKAVPQVELHSDMSSHSLQPPSTTF